MKELRGVLTLVALVALVVMAAFSGSSCAEGDDEEPARILDLFYFWDADGLIFNGRVSSGPQVEPANTRALAWTAPGDDGFDGEAALYDVRYVLSSHLPAGVDGAGWLSGSFESAPQLLNEPFPKKAGRMQQLILPRLAVGDSVWMAMRTFDEIGLDSKISNVLGPFQIHRLQIPLRAASGSIVNNFGKSLDQAGDVNKDTYMDVIVGSPDEGVAYLIPGVAGSSFINLNEVNANGVVVYRALREMLAVTAFTGVAADEFGAAVAGAGLFNADAYHDLAMGAPGHNAGTGKVYVNYGAAALPDAVVSADLAGTKITGAAPGDRFGQAIATVGDLNGDGVGELLVGAPGNGAGVAYLFSGSIGFGETTVASATVKITGAAGGDGLGAVVAGIGDVNGDGHPDFAVGAPFHDLDAGTADSGAVYVFYGGATIMSTAAVDLAVTPADVTIKGTVAGANFGSAITAGGNLVGGLDSAGDFAVTGGQTVFVFMGGDSGVPPIPYTSIKAVYQDAQALARVSRAGGEFGAAISGVGDFNFDGIDDLVVGAPGEDVCYVYEGPITALTDGAVANEAVVGAAGTRYCEALAAPGDVNADGYVDLLIGAPSAGEAYLTF